MLAKLDATRRDAIVAAVSMRLAAWRTASPEEAAVKVEEWVKASASQKAVRDAVLSAVSVPDPEGERCDKNELQTGRVKT